MEWTNAIPWGISGAMFIIALVTLIKNNRKDLISEQSEENSKLETIRESLLKANLKLDQVCSTTNETRSDIKAMNEKVNAIENRVVQLETRVEAIEKREV